MDIFKFSSKLFLSHFIVTVLLVAFLPITVAVKNIGVQWIIGIIYMVLFWLVIWADSASRGERDVIWSESLERKRKETGQEITLDVHDKKRMYHSTKGLWAGLIASIPAFILLMSMVVSLGNKQTAKALEAVLRIWLVPYIQIFKQFNTVPPYLFLILLLLFPVISGIGYTYGPVKRKKVHDIIEKSKKQH